MYFPRNIWGAFGIAHSLLKNCQISDERCDLMSFVLVEGVEYGKRWRHQTAKQRHQTEPGSTMFAHRARIIIYINNIIIKLVS